MNAENFSEYLKNPSFLYQISYEELKTLTLQYPYSQNLRLLLLQKSRLDNNKDYERNFRIASAYSVDRPHFCRFLKETADFDQASETTLDDVLELRDLSELDLPAKETVSLGQSAQSTADEPPPPTEVSDFSLDFSTLADAEEPSEDSEAPGLPTLEDLSDTLPSSTVEEDTFIAEEPLVFTNSALVENLAAISAHLEGKTVPRLDIEEYKPTSLAYERVANLRRSTILGHSPAAKVKPFFAPNHLIKTGVQLSAIVEEFVSNPATDSPGPQPERLSRQRYVPKTATIFPASEEEENDSVKPQARYHFKSWRQVRENSPLENLLGKHEQNQKQDPGAEVFAAQSVRESKDVASETLAELLVQQGQLEKAMEMYRRLSLIFPEKSSYFANKIEMLEIKKR